MEFGAFTLLDTNTTSVKLLKTLAFKNIYLRANASFMAKLINFVDFNALLMRLKFSIIYILNAFLPGRTIILNNLIFF